MEEVKVGIVILNYKAYQETMDCVQTFQAQTYKNIQIIVVENGSENESVKVLQEAYKEMENVHVIVSNDNLGFARGNNLGIRYAKDKLTCDAVIVINSDTLVQPTLVEEWVDSIEPEVAVISPKVIHMDGSIQVPAVNASNMPQEILRTISRETLINSCISS